MAGDIIIRNAHVVTVNPAFDIIPNGTVHIHDDRIAAVGPAADAESAGFPEGAEILDAAGGMVMPGLVNAHTHLPMTLFRGLADDLPLHIWLNEHIFPAEARHIRPETAAAAALLGCAEMLLSGTTTCCDGYFHEAQVAEALLQSGMRGVPAQGVIDFPAPGVPDPTRNIAAAREFIESFKERSPLITPSIFCHSPYTCSADTLVQAKALARELGVLFQIHVAETRSEREQSLAAHGQPPIQYLSRLGLLDAQTLLVHAVWTDAAEMEIIAASGAGVAHAAESNMQLASGVAPVPAMLKKGIAVGLGTDGCAGNNNLDLLQEMDTVAKLHKVFNNDPTIMSAREVIRAATIEGARAIGLDHAIGSLEPGKQADLIIIDTHQPHLMPLYHPESQIVYAARGADVHTVLVAGRKRVANRRLVDLDPAAVMARVVEMGRVVFYK
jgi:5-methylthioadenosine/S-adenosylhomocysteine deaminase